jgi:tripartite-type tricarboxylate transporter receptor subunit TctC
VAESGLPGYDYKLWYSVVAPARLPAAIQKRLNAEIVKFLNDAETVKKLSALGADPRSSTPEDLTRLADSERKSLGKVIRALNVKAE